MSSLAITATSRSPNRGNAHCSKADITPVACLAFDQPDLTDSKYRVGGLLEGDRLGVGSPCLGTFRPAQCNGVDAIDELLTLDLSAVASLARLTLRALPSPIHRGR